jgi:ATP-dependent phosphoenolpyruvate carboxykinase
VYETGTAVASSGALTAYSGKKTGRSPLDKRIVKESTSENDIWYALSLVILGRCNAMNRMLTIMQ